MPDTIITNARLIDPATGLDAPGALLIRDGLIADHGAGLTAPEGAATLDAKGAILAPGLIDLRASLGEPGFEHRETIASAARAAAAGGITTLCALPDTEPALDDPALLQFIIRRGEATGSLTILPYGAATAGCQGKEMAEFGLLREAGAIAFTDGRRAIGNARAMRLALSYARGFGCFVVQHPEEPSLAAGGAATEGELASRLGLPGIPAAAEAILVARDIALVRLTRGHVHFAHVSTGAALDLIRAAKAEGLAVTCDTAPPYFDLNETAIGDYRTYAKLSPPLRREADRLAVVAALADGTIDAIASDHQPHDADDKRLPFAQAEAGGAGLATLLGVTLARFHGGDLTLIQALDLLTARPARLLGLESGRLAKGAPADLVLFDAERGWKVEAGKLPGKAQNSPFDGRALEGRVIATFKAGSRVFGG
ncbi:dihydroorotase [Plastoroseomonas hellenica]|uniref:Dihydroorotase n=1 Tax=Plastoroseomonas hellenica TaxID=2687306 RepID=A0ABS5EZ91_9PROT|nr:dihydroorotase [Plastoroseomonas hellenica]MBR0642837.1 amidohydrolase family protein [Plastoroseomonas hellenica]MBR0665628.1 amidohydrolase family protein [Plastoroseomonas hellenica]